MFDCTGLDIGLDELASQVSGLTRPSVLNGPGFMAKSAGARDALLKFLQEGRMPLRSPRRSLTRGGQLCRSSSASRRLW